jgi:hypothetical protein
LLQRCIDQRSGSNAPDWKNYQEGALIKTGSQFGGKHRQRLFKDLCCISAKQNSSAIAAWLFQLSSGLSYLHIVGSDAQQNLIRHHFRMYLIATLI